MCAYTHTHTINFKEDIMPNYLFHLIKPLEKIRGVFSSGLLTVWYCSERNASKLYAIPVKLADYVRHSLSQAGSKNSKKSKHYKIQKIQNVINTVH